MTKTDNGKEKRESLFRKISSIVTGVIFVLALAAIISLTLQSIGGKTPSLFGYKFYYIATDSMLPSLKPNDVILSRVLDHREDQEDERRYITENIKEGDVVTYIAEYGVQRGLSITHQVVEGVHFDAEVGRYVISAQGTKFGAPVDPPVPIENIQAVMVKKVGFVAAIYNFATSLPGLIILIAVPAAFMLAVLILRLVRVAKGKPPAIDPERKAEIEKEIAEKAVRDYEELIKKKKEIAERAVAEFKAAQEKENSGRP